LIWNIPYKSIGVKRLKLLDLEDLEADRVIIEAIIGGGYLQ